MKTTVVNLGSTLLASLLAVSTLNAENWLPAGEVYPFGEQILGFDILYAEGWRAQGVRIGIIGTGIWFGHSDLSATAYTNEDEAANNVDDDANGFVDDLHGWNFVTDSGDISDFDGSGTALAGIIAGTHSNRIGVTGIAQEAKLVALKVVDTVEPAPAHRLRDAFDYAQALELDFLLLSVPIAEGGLTADFLGAVERYQASGGVLVIPAGDEGRELGEGDALATLKSFPKTISVSGLNHDLTELAPRSNYSSRFVDILAPAEAVAPSLVTELSTRSVEGTHVSAAMVTATCCLAKANLPDLQLEQLLERVLSTAQFIPSDLHYARYQGVPHFTRLRRDLRQGPPKIISQSISPARPDIYLNETVELSVVLGQSDAYVTRVSDDGVQPFVLTFSPARETWKHVDAFPLSSDMDFTVRVATLEGAVEISSYALAPISSTPFPAPNASYPQLLSLGEMNREYLGLDPFKVTFGGPLLGSRPMEIRWFRDGVPLDLEDPEAPLTLLNEPASVALYRIEATNAAGTFEHEIQVSWGGRKISETPPVELEEMTGGIEITRYGIFTVTASGVYHWDGSGEPSLILEGNYKLTSYENFVFAYGAEGIVRMTRPEEAIQDIVTVPENTRLTAVSRRHLFEGSSYIMHTGWWVPGALYRLEEDALVDLGDWVYATWGNGRLAVASNEQLFVESASGALEPTEMERPFRLFGSDNFIYAYTADGFSRTRAGESWEVLPPPPGHATSASVSWAGPTMTFTTEQGSWWLLDDAWRAAPPAQYGESTRSFHGYSFFSSFFQIGAYAPESVLLEDQRRAPDRFYRAFIQLRYGGVGSWYHDPALGWLFIEGDTNWLWSPQHGWWHMSNLQPGSAALYDPALGWLYFDTDTYPLFFQYSTGHWIRYLDQTSAPRWFFDFSDNRWFSTN